MPNIIKSNNKDKSVEQFNFSLDFMQSGSLEDADAASSGEQEDEAVVMSKQAAKVLQDAVDKAEEILNAAREQGEVIEKEAYDKGWQIGYDDGSKEGYQKAYEDSQERLEYESALLERDFESAIHEFDAIKKKLLDKYLEDLKNISVAVGEKVIQVSLKSSGDIIKRMIISATDKLKKTQWVKIYIAKCDADLMVEGDMELLNALSHLSGNIKIITMENEERGTCIIELPEEIIDVSVNTQVENIKNILNNARL